jgi:glutaredoxin
MAIFATAFLISEYFNNKRIAEIQSLQDTIAIDILSSETQFDLLEESPCSQINDTVLSQELNDLASRLGYMEENLGTDNKEVVRIKRYYSLLQVKDYLLMQKLDEQCSFDPISIIYFYSNEEGECEDCNKAGHVLTYLREQYPQLRIYAFDYNLDLSALKTLISVYKIQDNLPALIIDGKVHYGFKDLEEMNKIMPELATLNATTTSATSTAATTTSTSTKR